MSWPAPNDYVDALQNPHIAFSDLELKAGRVTLEKLGLPKPVSGNFATVFEVSSGSSKWAVRCFLREVHDQERRYNGIAKYLEQANLKSVVKFQYLVQGVRVKGLWYPIVKMEWIQGIRLDEYIRNNLNNSSTLKTLTENWTSLMGTLRSHRIAHGDLQHGNILVTNTGEIKIIDYDGMYVPTLLGQQNSERGHRNYQHPSRKNDSDVTLANFLSVDNFSSWVIGSSIALVYLDPTLWQKTQAGDDNLLFREIDFNQPNDTGTWKLLMGHSDRRVRDLGRTLAELCKISSFLSIRPLDSNFLEMKSASQGTPGGSWIEDHRPSIPHKPTTDRKLPPKEYPGDFIIAEYKHMIIEFQNLSFLEKTRLRFRWQNFVGIYVQKHFQDYPFVKNKQRIEAQIKIIEAEKSKVVKQATLAQMPLIGIGQKRQQQIDAQRESDSLKRELDSITTQITDCDKQESLATTNYVFSQLNQHVLVPGAISGIGKARITALNGTGIRTAADIIAANEFRALNALQGIYKCVPEDDWRKLVMWRKAHENQIYVPFQIKDKYQKMKSNLLQIQGKKKQRLVELERMSWLSPDSGIDYAEAQAQVRQFEREIDRLDRELQELTTALETYERLTPQNLVEKLLK